MDWQAVEEDITTQDENFTTAGSTVANLASIPKHVSFVLLKVILIISKIWIKLYSENVYVRGIRLKVKYRLLI